MITKFNTPQLASGGKTSGSKTMITVILVAAAIYVGYRFVVKPMLDKNKTDDKG
jgi:hypothetical protein